MASEMLVWLTEKEGPQRCGEQTLVLWHVLFLDRVCVWPGFITDVHGTFFRKTRNTIQLQET